MNRGIKVLQTLALPLGYVTVFSAGHTTTDLLIIIYVSEKCKSKIVSKFTCYRGGYGARYVTLKF